MAATRSSGNVVKHITPAEVTPLGRRLSLECIKCGTTGRYDVGRVAIDPYALKVEKRDLKDAVFFSAYFHCRHCGAPGPWELSTIAVVQLMALATMAMASSDDARIAFAKSSLFDGTSHQTSALGEEHLKRLIDENPTDYFLWSRLGNLLKYAEQKQKAVEAFEKAVELNPQDIESHHSLGDCYLADAEPERAAEHFHAALRFARDYPHRDRTELLRGIVSASLEKLFDLHHKSGGKIPLMPEFDPPARERPDEPVVVHLMEFDLARPEDWQRFADTFLPEFARGTEPAKPQRDARSIESRTSPAGRWDTLNVEPNSDTPAPIRRGSRVGRNDPCPCGSGKKFKRCCGATAHPAE